MSFIKCYGKLIIPSLSIETYIWKFKNISKYGDTVCLFFGIDNANNPNCINKCLFRNKLKASYSYYVDDGRINDWTGREVFNDMQQMSQNDIITMKLQFTENNGILTFQLNDNKEIIASNNIKRDKSLKYRMTINMGTPRLSVQLL